MNKSLLLLTTMTLLVVAGAWDPLPKRKYTLRYFNDCTCSDLREVVSCLTPGVCKVLSWDAGSMTIKENCGDNIVNVSLWSGKECKADEIVWSLPIGCCREIMTGYWARINIDCEPTPPHSSSSHKHSAAPEIPRLQLLAILSAVFAALAGGAG